MASLSRFKSGLSKAKGAALGLGKSEKLGSAGHEIVTIGSHAVLALASKNVDQIGPVPVKPDVAGGLAGLGMMLLGKGKTKRLGYRIGLGAVHALITRFVSTGTVTLVNGPNGVHVEVGQNA
jgi:hypothetical protein